MTEKSKPGPVVRDLRRISINLPTKAIDAMDSAMRATGENKTTTVTRALQLYALAVEAVNGGGLYYRPADGGEIERIRLL